MLPVVLYCEACVGLRCLKSSVWALERSARAGSPSSFDGQPPSLHGLHGKAATTRMKSHLERNIQQQQLPTDRLPEPGQCLSEILKCADTFRGGDALTVRPYDYDELNTLKENITPVDFESLVSGEALEMAMHAEEFILLDPSETSAEAFLFQPYGDPALRERDTLLRLILRLHEQGLITFLRSRRGLIRPFPSGLERSVSSVNL